MYFHNHKNFRKRRLFLGGTNWFTELSQTTKDPDVTKISSQSAALKLSKLTHFDAYFFRIVEKWSRLDQQSFWLSIVNEPF